MRFFLRSRHWIAGLGIVMSSAVWAQASAPMPTRSVQDIIGGRCAVCHGAQGESASAVYPRLAAQHPAYLQKQLRDFRDGQRNSDTMSEMARDLKDEEIAALAAHFSAQKAGARQPGDEELASIGRYIFNRGDRFSGVPACTSCHGPKGHGTERLPRLAGQHPAYLETQLTEFSRRERTNDNAIMQSIAAKLTPLEIHALSVYIGSLP